MRIKKFLIYSILLIIGLVIGGCSPVEVVRTTIPFSGGTIYVKTLDSTDESVSRILSDAITMELTSEGYSLGKENKANIILTGTAWLKMSSSYALIGANSGNLYGGGSTLNYIDSVSVKVETVDAKLLAMVSYSCDREQWTRIQSPTAIGKKIGHALSKKLKE